MPRSCKCILDRAVFKGAMTTQERDKIMRNIVQCRCKDCKHFGTDPKWPICSEHDVVTDPNGFCSWAERKEDDNN